MNTDFQRSGDQIFVGEHVGTCSDSPNGQFSIGWYCSKTRGWMDSKDFVLIRLGTPVLWGKVASKIFEGKAADTGRFILHLVGKTSQSSLRIFEPNGQEFGTKQFRDGLIFFDISADGQWLISNVRSEVRSLNLATQDDGFSFQLEPRFNPTAATIEPGGEILLLRHGQKAWYRFAKDGNFLDKEKWFADYVQECDGTSLFQVMSDLYAKQGAKDAAEAVTYAQWIEEALRRGVDDSYHIKLSSVYGFLAKLYSQAGDRERASQAEAQAENHLDGFTLIDRTAARLKALGNPPDLELARRLVNDLARAPETKRVLEYPNYVGKMHRTNGELLEILGDIDGAIVAYRMALEANPQAGCKRQLERLTNEPVVLAERPKPKPSEERVNLDQATMFHFVCPVCGGTPHEIKMSDYLIEWQDSGTERLERMLSVLRIATEELKNNSVTSPKQFLATADNLLTLLPHTKATLDVAPNSFLISVAPKTLVMQIECPVCQKPAGLRKKDRYFTVWSEACRVQSSNLFYEAGTILLGLRSAKFPWLDDKTSSLCDSIVPAVFRAGEAVGLMPCPRCGRFTSCLYGGSRSNPEQGMCRWCSDASGATSAASVLMLALHSAVSSSHSIMLAFGNGPFAFSDMSYRSLCRRK